MSNGAPQPTAFYGTLIAVTASGNEVSIPLDQPTLRVGRTSENDVVLPEAAAAEHHILIMCSVAGVEVLDLGTGEPALLDGVPLTPHEATLLNTDSVVSIGSARLFFYLEDAAGTTSLAYQGQELLGTLLVVDQAKRTQVLPLTTPTVRIGSALDNDILLDQADTPAYSAQVVVSDVGIELVDLVEGTTKPFEGWQQVGTLRLYAFKHNVEPSEAVFLTLPALKVPQVEIVVDQQASPEEADTDPNVIDAEVVESAQLTEATYTSDTAQQQKLEALVDSDDLIDLAAELAADDLSASLLDATPVQAQAASRPVVGTLVLIFPGEKRRTAAMYKPTVRVGRDPMNDIIVDDPSVAPFHLQIFCSPPHYQMFALDAHTELDDSAVQAYTTLTVVGDSVIKLGDLRMYIYPPDVEIEPSAPLATGRKEKPPVEVVPAEEYAQAQQQKQPHHAPEFLTGIEMTPQFVRVKPGEQVKAIVRLINHAPIIDHLSLDIQGLPLGWFSFSTPKLPLFPGTRGEIELMLHPPPEPSALVGVYPFSVQVDSEHHPEATPSLQAQLEVKPYTEFQVSIFPPLQSGARAADYTVNITNFSNHRQMLTVHCYDPQQVFLLPFEDRLLWVDPGASYQFNLTMRLRRRWWWGAEQTYAWTLNVQSEDLYLEQAKAEFRHVPLIRKKQAQPKQAQPKALPPPRHQQQSLARPLRLAPPTVLTPMFNPALAAPHSAETVELPLETQPLDIWEPAHMTAAPSIVRCEAGGTATSTVSITQRADIVDRFMFEVEGVPASWVTLTPPDVSLLPNARGDVQIIISPPRKSQSSAGKRTLRVIARSEKFPEQTVVVPLVLDILPFDEFRITLLPAERTVRRVGQFTVTVANRGNRAQEFAVSCHESDDVATFQFNPSMLQVDPGATTRTTLSARLYKRLFVGQQELYPFTVRVAPTSEPDLLQEIPGRLQAKPLIPMWLIQILVPFLMIIVAVALATGRLNIRNFAQGIFGGGSSSSNSASAPDVADIDAALTTTPGAAVPGDETAAEAEQGPAVATTPPIFLEGTNRWTLANSPVQLDTTYVLSPNASLEIDSGVEVLVAPGASLQVYGQLTISGVAGAPVRFNQLGATAWGDVAILNGASASVSGLELRNAGSTGQAMLLRSATVEMSDLLITASRGGVRGYNVTFNGRNLTLVGNNLGSLPALAIELVRDNQVTLDGLIVRQNNMSAESAALHFSVPQIDTSLTLRNSLIDTPSLVGVLFQAEEAYQAELSCNTILQSTNAVALNNLDQAQAAQVRLENNTLGAPGQTGLYSAVQAVATNNWWGIASGPQSANNPGGSGSAMLGTAQIEPWLEQAPSCAPTP